MPTVLTEKQWSTLLKVLSLDLTLPFYAAMGVPAAVPEFLQRSLRESIEAWIRQEAEDGQNPTRASFALLALSRLGEDAQATATWGKYLFLGYHADQPEWSAWQEVISAFAHDKDGALGFMPPNKQAFYYQGYRERARIEDIEAQEEEAMRASLSDWDLGIYAMEGYGCAWESGPFSVIEWIVRVERLKRFAAEFWAILTPEERAEFHRRGQAYLDKERIWMPGPLPRLEDLLEAP